MRRIGQVIAVLLALLGGGSIASATQERASLLVGGPDALWLVTIQTDNAGKSVSRVTRRATAGEFESRWPAARGAATAAAAGKGQLAVFFAGGNYVSYFAESSGSLPGLLPPENLLGQPAEVLVACFDGQSEQGFFILVNRRSAPNTTQPAAASVPASMPATTELAITSAPSRPSPAEQLTFISGRELAVVHYNQQWTHVDVLPAPVEAFKAVSMVSLGERLYVLYRDTQRDTLLVRDKGWHEIPLPAEGGQNLTLVALNGEPVLVRELLKDKSLLMQTLRGQSWEGQVALHVEKETQPHVWNAAPPLVAGTDKKLALLWQENGQQFLSFATAEGEMTRPQKASAEKGGDLSQANQAWWFFLCTALTLTVILMFWPGQPMRMAPFSLLDGMQPASLARRLGAMLIDTLPFPMIGGMFVPVQGDPWSLVLTPEIMYVSLIVVGAYLLYGVLMECLLGATLGKMAMHLRVVGDKGARASFREILLRNITKIPEVYGPILIFSVLFPIFSRLHQRIGERIAWTCVIDTRFKPLPPKSPPPPPASDTEV